MKWLLALLMFGAVVAAATAGMFVIGCFMVPSLDEGSHGMAVPLMLGYLGFVYSLPVGFVAAIVWLIIRIRRQSEQQKLILRAIDESESHNTPEGKNA